MAVGSYGIVRPADVSPADVEILFHYVTGRTSTAPVTLKKLKSEDILTPVYHNSNTTDDTAAPDVEILGGLYNLKLSASDFTDLGIYTLHIRPKQIRTTITDCGILASLPSVRGLVIDLSNGIFYDCVGDAAFVLNLKRDTLKQRLNGRRNNKTSYVYI